MRALSPTTTEICALWRGSRSFRCRTLSSSGCRGLSAASGHGPAQPDGLPFHIAIVWWFDGRLSTITTPGWWKMLLRGLLNFAAYTAYYLGLATLPMAETVALFFMAPLFITLPPLP